MRRAKPERGEPMDTAQRMQIIRVITKMDAYPDFCKKIGVRNISGFRTENTVIKKDTAANRERQEELQC